MGCHFGVQLRNLDACSKVPLAAQSRSAGLRMPRGGKRVSEAVAARRHCHPRGHHGPANLFLNDRAIEVVAPLLPTCWVSPAFALGEHPVPAPFLGGVGVFPGQGVRQGHLPQSRSQIAGKQAPHLLLMAAQRRDQPTDDGWCAVELFQHLLDLRRCHHHGHPPLHAGPPHPHGTSHQSCSRIRGWA